MSTTAAVTIRTVIRATEQITAPSGVGKVDRVTESDYNHSTTTAAYTTDLTSISSEIYSYIAGLTGTVSFIQGTIRIPDATAISTPAGYSSKVSAYSTTDANEAQAQEANYFTSNFALGAGDYSSAATLKTALQTAVAACIAQTPGPYA